MHRADRIAPPRFLLCVARTLLALLPGLAGCASLPRPAVPPAPVLLVSVDGLRADQLDLGITPNLQRLIDGGVRARWMTPSYPSLTFPNHYSIVTGLRPDRHGIVHNTMRDPEIGRFSLSDRDAVGDGRWWGGTPIWASAERAGLPTATLFWPGSEASIGGVRPARWRAYDESLPLETRVDIVLGWLSEPAATRPRFATLYMEPVDHEAHDHGPDSPQAHAAVRAADAAIGRLLDGLAARGQLDAVNLVLVSDHGMATVRPGRTVAIEDIVDGAQADVVTSGQVVGLVPKPGHEAAVERRVLGAHAAYDCWRKGDLPARWHYGSHPRIPPIVCQMREGRDAVTPERAARRPGHDRGSHGYDPALPSMRAVFLARGPAFVPGTTLPAFDNVDVYPLLARLLRLAPAPNDGDIAPLLPALRHRATVESPVR